MHNQSSTILTNGNDTVVYICSTTIRFRLFKLSFGQLTFGLFLNQSISGWLRSNTIRITSIRSTNQVLLSRNVLTNNAAFLIPVQAQICSICTHQGFAQILDCKFLASACIQQKKTRKQTVVADTCDPLTCLVLCPPPPPPPNLRKGYGVKRQSWPIKGSVLCLSVVTHAWQFQTIRNKTFFMFG